MIDLKRSVHRRGFLGSIAAGAAAVGITSLINPLRINAGLKVQPPGPDLSEFDAWLGKIKGAHKQVFDAPATNGGFPLVWSRVFLMTNKMVGAADNDVTAVVVLRHEAIPLAMESRLWEKYKLGENFKVTDGATKAPAIRNPFFHPKEGEMMLPGMAIEDLQGSGVLIGVCDMALTVYSKHLGELMKLDACEIKKDWVSGLIPGIQIVPSGVLAINRAQEHGCTYCYAG